MIQVKSIPMKIYEKNYYSQFGEDGIIERLKTYLVSENFDQTCVDVGAWDGEYLSNVRRQIEYGFNAILIEADNERHRKSLKNFENFPGVKSLNVFVNDKNPLSLILNKERVLPNFFLLSIDIDGADLDVFESLGEYFPLIVIIEFNPTIPNSIDFRNPYGGRVGSSARAIFESATKIGYKMVHVTQTNLIFVDPRFFIEGSFTSLTIEEAIDDRNTVKAVFSGYDGSLHYSGSNLIEFPWHGIAKDIAKMELPELMQKFPDELTPIGKVIFKGYWFKQYWKIALRSKIRATFHPVTRFRNR